MRMYVPFLVLTLLYAILASSGYSSSDTSMTMEEDDEQSKHHQHPPIIPAEFSIVDKYHHHQQEHYRIERQRASHTAMHKLLVDLVYDGIPQDEDEYYPFEPMTVRKVGDSGRKVDPRQLPVEDYAAALQNFIRPEYHTALKKYYEDAEETRKHNLLYLLEKLQGPSRDRTRRILSEYVDESIWKSTSTTGETTTTALNKEAGDMVSVHLYLSAPGTAALANHTDITDIAVLQLDGAKEWFLCTAAKQKEQDNDMIQPTSSPWPFTTLFSEKLKSCATYSEKEMDSSLLECEKTTLYPGDVLFLPRRVVHSARALPDMYSAHLTFGYHDHDQYNACVDDHEMEEDAPIMMSNLLYSRRGLQTSCDGGCDTGCQFEDSQICDGGCDSSCDNWGGSCDGGCDSSCYPVQSWECDESCDSSCDNIF